MGCSHSLHVRVPKTSVSATVTQEPVASLGGRGMEHDDWASRDEVLRVFDLAQKDDAGRLDMKEFAYILKDAAWLADLLTGAPMSPRNNSLDLSVARRLNIEADLPDSVSRTQWLAYFYSIAQKNDILASSLVYLYEEEFLKDSDIRKSCAFEDPRGPAASCMSDWPLRDEALRVFDLADKDSSGELDLEELCGVRNNPGLAQTMMDVCDTDFSGTLSKAEWLNYFYKLFLKKEASARAILRLYERQIRNPKTITLAKATTWDIIDYQQSTDVESFNAWAIKNWNERKKQ